MSENVRQAPGVSRADLLLVPILLVAAAIRIASAGYGLWFDEIASLAFAHQPLGHLWGAWMLRETNPPLFYTILKGWAALFGEGDRALRLLPTLIGLGGIIAAWALARRIGGRRAGLIAAAMLALSASHVDFSQEVRGYILAHGAALTAALAMAGYLEERRTRWLVLYGAAATAALYSHTTMALFVALANAAMLWLLRTDFRALGRWIAANAAVALLWAWWAWISVQQMGMERTNFRWITRPDMAVAWSMTQGTYLPTYALEAEGFGLTLLFLLMLGGMAWLTSRDRRPMVRMLAALSFGAPVLLFAASQIVPVFTPRTLYWASGPAIVMTAAALARLPSRAMLAGVVLLLLAFEALVLSRWLPSREEEGWRAALAAIGARSPDAVLLVQGDAVALAAGQYLPEVAPGVRIVVLEPRPGAFDAWADGMATAPHVDAAGAVALLRREGALYTLRRGDSEPGTALASAGTGREWDAATDGRQPHVSRWRWRIGR